MTKIVCPDCSDTVPHDHGVICTPSGVEVAAVIYRVADPNAEVRDPDTGEVIFPARKAPFRLLQGGRALQAQQETSEDE